MHQPKGPTDICYAHLCLHKLNIYRSGGDIARSLYFIFLTSHLASMTEMASAKGRANYKVALLIEAIEQKLHQGTLGWKEVAALYQFRSQEGFTGLCECEEALDRKALQKVQKALGRH